MRAWSQDVLEVVVCELLTTAVTGVRAEWLSLLTDARAGGAGTVSAGDTSQHRLVPVGEKVNCGTTILISAIRD